VGFAIVDCRLSIVGQARAIGDFRFPIVECRRGVLEGGQDLANGRAPPIANRQS
jgi:hypothetical protein